MNRWFALSFGMVVLMVAAPGEAADKAKPPAKKPAQFAEYDTPLVMPQVVAQLKLTDDQETKVVALFKEFDKKNAEALDTARKDYVLAQEDLKKANAAKDKDAIKKAQAAVKAPQQTLTRFRDDYLARFFKLLTDAQRKSYEDIRAGRVPE